MKILSEEELKETIYLRYGSFELSHDKNVLIVQSILDFILKQRREYAQYHVEKALEAAGNIADDWENSGELKPEIIDAYPLNKII